VARSQVAGGPELFGVLLGAIGAGAVVGAFVLPRLRERLGADGSVLCIARRSTHRAFHCRRRRAPRHSPAVALEAADRRRHRHDAVHALAHAGPVARCRRRPRPRARHLEYLVDAGDRDSFLEAIGLLAQERRRDGAYGWAIFEDAAQYGRFLETFYVASWLEHLRQHERVTQADKALQERVNAFHRGEGRPAVSHFIATD
jgi:hypothetical protein